MASNLASEEGVAQQPVNAACTKLSARPLPKLNCHCGATEEREDCKKRRFEKHGGEVAFLGEEEEESLCAVTAKTTFMRWLRRRPMTGDETIALAPCDRT